MNYEAIMNKMERFFETVDPDALIKSLEKRGYEFVEAVPIDISSGEYITCPPIEIGKNGEFISLNRASLTCSIFLYLKLTLSLINEYLFK